MKPIMKWLLGLLFIAAGLNHFFNAEFYLRIMPPYLPWHVELVYISGVCEALLGALLLIPRFTPWAAWGLIALLIAVFPANLHMAVNAGQFPNLSPIMLGARLPLQGVLIWWAWWFTSQAKSAAPK